LPTSHLARPPRKPEIHSHATLSDRALSVFTDLRYSAIVTADHLDPLAATAELLMRSGVHMGFVTDVHGRIVGMVSAEQLSGERPLQRALAAHVHHSELTLEDLMTPLTDWAVVDAGELAHARVGDVVATLHATGQRYLFVTELLERRDLAARPLLGTSHRGRARVEHRRRSPCAQLRGARVAARALGSRCSPGGITRARYFLPGTALAVTPKCPATRSGSSAR
jgi:hypothetical protein